MNMSADGANIPRSDMGVANVVGDSLPGFAASLLEGSSDCIKVLETDGTLAYMSCNGLTAMEIDDFGTVQGRPWPSLWPEDARATLEDALIRARGGELTAFEASCPTAKGTEKWWSVTVLPVLDRTGQVDRIVASSRDISDRVRKDMALSAAIAQNETLVAQLQHLIAEMDHRIKNSLAMVLSFLRMRRRRSTDPSVHATLDEASNQVNSIVRLHEALQSSVEAQTIDAVEFAQKLLDDLGPSLANRATITLTADPSLEVIGSQASLLGLAMVEFVQNAVKHGHRDDDRHMNVSVRLHGLPDGGYFLRVEDDGPGLPAAFDLDSGVGLGLRVCVSGVRRNGGTVTAFNSDRGAVFEIHAPRADIATVA